MKPKIIVLALTLTGLPIATYAAAGGPSSAMSGAAVGSNATGNVSSTNPGNTTVGSMTNPNNVNPANQGTLPSSNGNIHGAVTANPGTTPDTAALSGSAVTHQQVMDAQRALSASGFNVTQDGVAGPTTLNAIKLFQATHGLTATGQLDSDTLNSLNSATPSSETPKATETPSPF